MFGFLLWLLLLFLCWPLALLALVLYPVVWLVLLPFRLLGIGVEAVFELLRAIVLLPARVSRVFAAGAPAEVLLYTLVPDMLVGRNHMPTAAALELTEENVKTRLHRARRLLREALERQAGPHLMDTFPFDGWRCERMTRAVIEKILSSP